jgi:hypothetical protein
LRVQEDPLLKEKATRNSNKCSNKKSRLPK